MKAPLLWLLLLTMSAQAAEPAGRWTAPTKDGRPWKHAATGLSFPKRLGTYRLAGEFQYSDGGVFIRYENLEDRARADIFLFKTVPAPTTLEDKHRRILSEIDTVTADLQKMVSQGRYKNLSVGEIVGGELDLWQQASVPIATRTLTATRLGISDQGAAEAVVKTWVGITLMSDHLITIRHMRPADTGDAGEDAMKALIGLIFQVLKDPSLRAHIKELLAAYLAQPMSQDGDNAAAAVLAYLKQTPYFPISIPEDPVSDWLQHCKAVAPGTEDHLLRAFMLGSASPALEDADAETCLNAGARQFARIYRQLLPQYPQITRPEMEQFVTAAEKNLGAAWLKERADLTR